MIALLTIPAATAQLFFKTVKGIMLAATLITLFASISGLMLAYYLDFVTGPLIVLVISFIYLVGIALSRYVHK